MNNLNKEKIEEYNSLPVFYCKHCLSLKIRDVPYMEDSDYCDDCSSTDIGQCNIEEWEELYKNKYGFKYLSNGR